VFGHWSSLGLIVEANLIGIDTGCVWNRELTAVQLDRRQKIVQVDCSE
jgi:bis(5'-nucleosyl)-tetraphosphatase (symmetrical)